MISNIKAKKLKNKFRVVSANIAVIHEGCSDLIYRNKEVLSTDGIANAIHYIVKLCLICWKTTLFG